MKRLLFLCLGLMGVAFANDLMPHNEPIVFTDPPQPNVMMVFDSSGSMLFFDMEKPEDYTVEYGLKNFTKSTEELVWNNQITNPKGISDYNAKCVYRPSQGNNNDKYASANDKKMRHCNPKTSFGSAKYPYVNQAGKYSRVAVLKWTLKNMLERYGAQAQIGLAPLANPTDAHPMQSVFDKSYVIPTRLVDEVGTLTGQATGFITNFTARGGTPLNNSIYRATAYLRGVTIGSKENNKPTFYKPSPITYRCQEQHLILLTDGAQNVFEIPNSSHRAFLYADWYQMDGVPATASDTNETSLRSIEHLGAFLRKIDIRDDLMKNSPNPRPVDLAGKDWMDESKKMNFTTHAITFGTDADAVESEQYLRRFVGQTFTGRESGGKRVDPNNEANWDDSTAWGVYASAADTSALDEAFHKIFQAIIKSRSGTGRVKDQSSTITTEGVEYSTKYSPNGWAGEIIAYEYDPETEHFTDQAWSTNDAHKIEANQGAFYSAAGGKRILLKDLGVDSRYINWLMGNQERTLRYRPTLGDVIDSHITYANKDHLNINLQRIAEYRIPEYLDYLYQKNRDQNLYNLLIAGSNDGLLNILYADRNPKISVLDSNGKAQVISQGGRRYVSYFPSFFKDDLETITAKMYTHSYAVNGSTHLFDAAVGQRFYSFGVTSMGAGKEGLVGYSTYNSETGPEFKVHFELTRDNYPDLGYTYSEVEFFNQSTEHGPRAVAVFGNGYRPNGGSVVYLINAYNGDLLSKVILPGGSGGASSPALEVSISGDGYQQLDRIYVGDQSGKLYRVTFDDNDLTKYDTQLLIDLGQPITVRPTIAYPSGSQTPWVLVGTGRAILLSDAKSTATNGFYAIKDTEVQLDTGKALLTVDDLHRHSVIAHNVPESDERDDKFMVETTQDKSEKSVNGWYLALDGIGERVIYPARIQKGDYVLFSTYGVTLDEDVLNDPCGGGEFYGKFMALQIFTGLNSGLYTKDGKQFGGFQLEGDAPGIPVGTDMSRGDEGSGAYSTDNHLYYDMEKLKSENPESQYLLEGDPVDEDAGFSTLKDKHEIIPDPVKKRSIPEGRLYLRNV